MPLEVGSGVPWGLAFGAGLVATINPCGFALLPSFVFFYLGSGTRGRTGMGRVADGLLVGLVVTGGFMLVFGSVGVAFAVGARAIAGVVPWVTVVMGAGLVALGVWLLAGKHLTVRIPGLRTDAGSGYRSLFVFGTAYAVGSLSCTLPVFLLVVGTGLAAGSLPGTVGVFLAYALGMATVLMLLCIGTAGFREVSVRTVRRLSPYLERISGALLVVGGAYVVYYWASLLGGDDRSLAVRIAQSFQRWAQELVLGVADRVWFLLGIGLAAAALVVVFVRLLRQRDLGEDEVAEETDEERPRKSEEAFR